MFRCPVRVAQLLMTTTTKSGGADHDDRVYFEFLVLESFQAGLSADGT
jgi:3-methyladenine DNA glycosylase Tag